MQFCSFCLAIGLITLATSSADESKDSKPKISENNKTTENGVSIKLKLLPSNQEGKPAESKEPVAETELKKAEGEPKLDTQKPNESKKDSQAVNPPVAPKSETGTVELKLLPIKPTEEVKKDAKPSGSVEMNLQTTKVAAPKATSDKPTGTVEMQLQTPKEKTDSTNGKVSIELVQRPARRTISDDESKPSEGKLVLELEQPMPKGSMESDNEDTSDEQASDLPAKPPGLKLDSSSNENRGGDPGDPGEEGAKPLPSRPGDIPLLEEANPIEVPEAEATELESRFRSTSTSPTKATAKEQERQHKIEAVLEYFRTHPENVVRRGPWALMHSILPYGVETEVIAGKRKVNAIGWLCHNGISAKQRMFQPTQSGFRTNVGPGVQGHEGQFLAILAQSHVQEDYPIQVGSRKYTIRDLVKYEMATCREKTELTFKLIGFTHYLKPDQTWRDNRGRPWSIEKLVAEELAQPINGEACGGTHRLMGLTCAVVSRQEAGLPITGHFERAEKFLNDFVEYTFSLQNPDGSFSTEWFERRAEESSIERKVQTTGHILEWLVYTLPDDHLKSPEIEKAVDFLLQSLGKNPSRDWPIGPRGHSLRALSLYHKRAFGSRELQPHANVATEAGGQPVTR